MALENNPLRQYFRRPAVYLKLPSNGQGYDADVLANTETGELPVFPMTAIDEITTKTPDALYNGTAVIEIIKSCIPSIKNPWKLSSVDFDAVLIAIKAASNGNELEIESTCPSCNEDAKYDINLSGVLASLKAGDYASEMPLGDLYIKFRPLSFKEMNEVSMIQFDLQRQFNLYDTITDLEEKNKKSKELLNTVTNITMQSIARTIQYIKTPSSFVDQYEFILDFIQSCDKHSYEAIKTHIATLKEQSESRPLKVRCIHCQHEYEQVFTLNLSDFFG